MFLDAGLEAIRSIRHAMRGKSKQPLAFLLSGMDLTRDATAEKLADFLRIG